MQHGPRPSRTLWFASLGLAAMILAAGARPALAYEFEVIARTLGQGYALRSVRFSMADEILSRRRFTQTLSLNIWDIGGRYRDRRAYDRPIGGPRIYLTTYLRIDHDFGAFTNGSLVQGNQLVDAIDSVPELEASALSLDVLFAYLAVDDLAGGLLSARLGRQLEVGTLDWWSMDGLTVRVTPELPVAVEAFAGLRVRDASPAGSATHEPDGTGSAECAEYVEGAVPGSGSWRPVDRDVIIENNPFTSDYHLCPQRRELMPTFGGALELRRVRDVWARVSYRRSVSPTPGPVGPVDRFENPDTGVYPNELGQAPDWGVNEDKLSASVRVLRTFAGGRGRLVPYAAVRYNALLGIIDEQHTGVSLRYRAHTLEPEYFYSFPSFDGDSIFNVFSTQAYHDIRMTYGFAPERSPLGVYARAWLRAFQTEDQPDLDDGVDPGNLAGGVQVGARYRLPRTLAARLELFHDAGYGGTRVGGYGSVSWHASQRTGLGARVSLVHVLDQDLRQGLAGSLGGLSLGAQAGVSYRIADGIHAHLSAEHTANRVVPSQYRLIGVLEFALVPEV